MRDRFALRAGLRRITPSKREAQCGVVPCQLGGPEVLAIGRPGAWRTQLRGVVSCGHIWSCPVCSERIRACRCERAMRAVRNAGGRWQMLTVTVAHGPHDDLRTLLLGLSAAWRRARQGGAVQRNWTARVTASIRSTEIKWHGRNGWHPHLHLALRTSAWSDVERTELLRRWQSAVERHLGAAHVPSTERGLWWSSPLTVVSDGDIGVARYVSGLGLEVTGAAGDDKGSPWSVARAAAEGDARAIELWREYCRATSGRRMIELDDRATRWAKIATRDEPERPNEQVRVLPIDSLELEALRAQEQAQPGILGFLLADAQVATDPETAVRGWIAIAQAGARARYRARAVPSARLRPSVALV